MLEVWSLSQEQWGAIKILDKGFMTRFRTAASRIFFLNSQTANIIWIMEKAKEFQKNIYFCFIDYTKAFGCVDHNKL